LVKIVKYQRTKNSIAESNDANKIRVELSIVKFLKDHSDIRINKFIHDWGVRPDILYEGGCYVMVEIDENQHSGYLLANDAIRTEYITTQLKQYNRKLPTAIIRFNPDGYLMGGKKVFTHMDIRLKKLVERILFYLENPVTDTTIEYMYFDC
jgi:hypothetical protein